MNKSVILWGLSAAAVIFLSVAVFGIINENCMAGPYTAEVSDRINNHVQISFGSNVDDSVVLIIPNLLQTVNKGSKAEVYTTSLIGKGKNPRQIRFFDKNNVLIQSVTLPSSPYIISTLLIFIIITAIALVYKYVPKEFLFRNYEISEEDSKKTRRVEDNIPDKSLLPIVFLFAIFFFFSGFCGLLYQTVWLRLAFSRFGVITPVVSVVVSTFMLGLGFGSWLAGRLVTRATEGKLNAVIIYGVIEAVIGCGAFMVPVLFEMGSHLLLKAGQTDSALFLAGSGICIALALLPFSIAMGATYPVALRAYEQLGITDRHRFGILYAFNTAGAVAGCVITVFALIELLGFRNTLFIGALLNFIIALSAIIFGYGRLNQPLSPRHESDVQEESDAPEKAGVPFEIIILFVTGFCSMASEVVWVRAFGSVLEQAVYTFGFLLVCYLIGHASGAWMYHLTVHRLRDSIMSTLLIAAALASCLAVVVANTTWMCQIISGLTSLRIYMAIAIGTYAAVLGWLTPLIIERYSKSNPSAAGSAYAVNIAGCVLGPLVSGYFLIPALGAQHSLIILCLPLIAMMFIERHLILYKVLAFCLSAMILIPSLFYSSWEEQVFLNPRIGAKKIYRDYAATTVSYTDKKGWKELIVNGQKMTTLSPVTKLMADLPLVLHEGPAEDVLVICLGMGTTYKTALTWGAKVTVVELVPGVVKAFMDDNKALESSNGRIIVDDGRRFLERTNEKFDIIIIDPPPPAEQPASSLLSSTEFYGILKKHLKPHGIVQLWYGHLYAEPAIARAFTRSAVESFSCIKIFSSVDDPFKILWGLHFICSMEPIQDITPKEFLEKLPADAKTDLKEMFFYTFPDDKVEAIVEQLISRQLPLEKNQLNNPSEKITDDRPFNEYYLIRRYREKMKNHNN